MNVVQFLGELPMIADVEIVVTLLPEMVGAVSDQAARDSLLERLDGLGQRVTFGFAQQKMHVFGHDDVSVDAELVTAADTFESFLEGMSGWRIQEQGFASVTREGDEVGLSGVVVTLE